jgi:prepilin-type N-terminal cleavage/methylation domain-containing protein
VIKSIKKGLTLIEISIGIVIISLLMVTVMKLFGTGMSRSQKGLSHLANMEAANILMSQIEYDLMRASEITDPAIGEKALSARWKMLTDQTIPDTTATVSYQNLDEAVKRTLIETGKTLEHTYCKGLKAVISFERVKFTDPKTGSEKQGLWINLSVSSPKKMAGETEKFDLKRLIMCKNF